MILDAILRALRDDIIRTLRALALSVAAIAVLVIVALVLSSSAHAQVPADAARYRLDLRRQAQLVWGARSAGRNVRRTDPSGKPLAGQRKEPGRCGRLGAVHAVDSRLD